MFGLPNESRKRSAAALTVSALPVGSCTTVGAASSLPQITGPFRVGPRRASPQVTSQVTADIGVLSVGRLHTNPAAGASPAAHQGHRRLSARSDMDSSSDPGRQGHGRVLLFGASLSRPDVGRELGPPGDSRTRGGWALPAPYEFWPADQAIGRPYRRRRPRSGARAPLRLVVLRSCVRCLYRAPDRAQVPSSSTYFVGVAHGGQHADDGTAGQGETQLVVSFRGG